MYPITYEADFKPTPSRGTTFFRLLLAIPWFIVALFWGVLYAFTHLIALIVIVVVGRYPVWAYNFNSGVVRFGIRLNGWLTLQTDEWPPFGLADDRAYPIRVNIPGQPEERQSRLKALFRIVLILPMLFVIGYGTAGVVYAAAWVAWLTIVFRGYMPEGVFNMLTYCNALHARVTGYYALFTDDYPPIGLEAAKGTDASPAPPAPPAPPAEPAV